MINYEYIFAIEGNYSSRSSLHQLLKGDLELYTYLLEHNYLKFSQNEGVAFNYVGVIAVGVSIICVLPKYYRNVEVNNNDKLKDFSSILKVLKKVGQSNNIPDLSGSYTNEFSGFSEIVFCDKFLKDYLEYGLFNKSDVILSVDGDGVTDWGYTFTNLNPIFSKGRPIYHSTYTSLALSDELNVIREIHKWVLKYSLAKYGKILDYNFDFTYDVVNELSDLGSIDFLSNILRKELNAVYTDREILLLKRLIYFIKNVNNQDQNSFSLYGTCYFHVVWEKVCSFLFDDQFHLFVSLIPKPDWFDLVGNSVSKETFVPDIISTMEGGDSSFFILDAKYYNLKYIYPSFDVIGNPGIADVSKQFLYEKAFSSVHYQSLYNCLLFPKIMEDFFELAGGVKFSLFKDDLIYNLYLSPTILYNSYLKNTRICKNNLPLIKEAIDSYNSQSRKPIEGE